MIKNSPIARLVPPHGDKHWSFQIVFPDNDLPATGEFVLLMQTQEVQQAKPFLQGHNGNWAMIEFWVKEKQSAQKAAQTCATHFKVELQEGNFTRRDLGLE